MKKERLTTEITKRQIEDYLQLEYVGNINISYVCDVLDVEDYDLIYWYVAEALIARKWFKL